VLIVEDEPSGSEEYLASAERGPNICELRCIQHACSRKLPAGNISSAYRKPDTCRQHPAPLTRGMSYSEPASVDLYLLSLLALAVISIGWLLLRVAGPRAARA
jgi:hypothetical protein